MINVNEAYNEIYRGVNSFNSAAWLDAVKGLGVDATKFASMVVTQYDRMNGNKYSDYNHEVNGWRNYENVCSIMADMRNDQAFKLASRIVDSGFESDFEGIPYEKLRESYRDDELTSLLKKCVWDMHRTCQQSLVRGCADYLKEEGLVDSSIKTSMWMI